MLQDLSQTKTSNDHFFFFAHGYEAVHASVRGKKYCSTARSEKLIHCGVRD